MVCPCWWHFFHSSTCFQWQTQDSDKTHAEGPSVCLAWLWFFLATSFHVDPQTGAGTASIAAAAPALGGSEAGGRAGMRRVRSFLLQNALGQLPPPVPEPIPPRPGRREGPGGESRRRSRAAPGGGAVLGAARRGGGAGSPRSPRPGCAVWQRLCQSAWLHSCTPCVSSIIPPPPPGVSASLRAGSAAATAAAAAAGRMRGRRGAGQRWAARSGVERRGAGLPPGPPRLRAARRSAGCGQPRRRPPRRAGAAAMDPPAGIACVLLCCALALPAGALRRPGDRGRSPPSRRGRPAAVGLLALPRRRCLCSPPVRSRYSSTRGFPLPLNFFWGYFCRVSSCFLQAAGRDGVENRGTRTAGGEGTREPCRQWQRYPGARSPAAACCLPRGGAEPQRAGGQGAVPGDPRAGWSTWQLVCLLLLLPRPPPPSKTPGAPAADRCLWRSHHRSTQPRGTGGSLKDVPAPCRLPTCTLSP